MRARNVTLAFIVASIVLLITPTEATASRARSAAFATTTSLSKAPLADLRKEQQDLDLPSSSPSIVTRGGDSSSLVADLLERLKIASYFALWYALNIVYNIINKKVLNVLPAPLTVGTIQFGVGALYASLLWLLRLRPTPTLTKEGKRQVSHIGFHHAIGQLLSMVSLGAGPVSFTHIVKALEPFFSALVSALVFGKWMRAEVYATLIPVVGGVGYACLKEKSFSWLAFYTAMGSNLAFALRAVLSKSAMTAADIGTNLSSANLFGLVTWAAFVISIPIALLGEGGSFWEEFKVAEMVRSELVRNIVLSGLFHYLNNEVMYLALSNVHPVTLAVGNTMKRVFIMVASVLVFRNPVSLQAGIGSAIGISGVLLYSLTKQHYEALQAQEEAATSSKKGKKKVAVKKKRRKKL